jgi:hypothetical protein
MRCSLLYLQSVQMPQIDDYIIDVLMRDLVGHDRRPVSFLVYLWLTTEEVRRGGAVEVSYQELAESIGISKSSAQVAVSWLSERLLLTAKKETVTATPHYTVNHPWRQAKQDPERKRETAGK